MGRKGDHLGVSCNNNNLFYYTLESYNNLVSRISIIDNCHKNEQVSIVEYSPFLFGSLLSKTPREEFELLYDSLSLNDTCEKHEFTDDKLKWWKLDSVSDLEFNKLSGGYRKFVFIATQIEARKSGENIIGINIQQQIDDKRFKIIEKSLINKEVNSVLWVEENVHLLLRKAGSMPSKITFSEWLTSQNSFFIES